MKALLKQAIKGADYASALRLLQSVAPSDDAAWLEYAGDSLAKLPDAFIDSQPLVRKKLALQGGATTQFLVPQIRLFALARGIWLDVLEGEYGLFEQVVWSDSPELHAFGPDVIVFHLCSQNLRLPASAVEADATLTAEVERFTNLYATAAQRFGCSIVADNFTVPIERTYANLEATTAHSPGCFIRNVNQRVASALPAQVLLHDVEHLSSVFGKRAWHDPAYWDQAKTAVSFPALPVYAASLASILAALFGRSKKCLVLDLDNTLWGGVIGDDGLSGIHLGEGNPQGEAFSRFQRYVKALGQRGVLLTIASKNEIENAWEPFRQHPETVLRENDFSCVRANWEPKDRNIREIAAELNIGLDSLVFFDDNPAERELVRTNLPEVTVLEVPTDPALYVRCLDDAQLFGSAFVTDEDTIRAAYFQQARERTALSATSGSYDDYLQALEMVANVGPIDESNLARVTQLINKTNQFNLVTRRLTEADVRALIDSPGTYTSTIRLSDKFGAAGLISVVTGTIQGNQLTIDDWLMSCRVLKRDVEAFEMERIVGFCRERGVQTIVGRYIPSAKNKLVEAHYAQLGFKPVACDGPGTQWQIDLAHEAPKTKHHIRVE